MPETTSTDPRFKIVEILYQAHTELTLTLDELDTGRIFTASQSRQLGQLLIDLSAMERELTHHILSHDDLSDSLADQNFIKKSVHRLRWDQ